MQKALSDLANLPEAELSRLFEREPLLVTHNGEPRFVAQSMDAFESMVRRLRELEKDWKPPTTKRLGKLFLLRR